MLDRRHPSHETRVSIDASSYDEICVHCGATDIAAGGWGELAKPCTAIKIDAPKEPWYDYRGDFNAMTDEEIEQECEIARNRVAEEESWLEAVESWKQAGRPRSGELKKEWP